MKPATLRDSRFLRSCMLAAAMCCAAYADAVSAESVEQEVRGNVLRQRVGLCTVGDFALPDEFVDRVVDRIIRASYQERNHTVVRDGKVPEINTVNGPDDRGADTDLGTLRILTLEQGESVARCRRSLKEARPTLRGYRAPILGDAAKCRPMASPEDTEDDPSRRAAEIVATRIARDGLLPTVARAIEVLGPADFTGAADRSIERLRAAGVPVDLLRYFDLDGDHSVVEWIARRLVGGESAEGLAVALASARFKWTSSVRGFRVVSESGEHAIGGVRMQLTRGTVWGGKGAGGNLDVARQLLTELSEAWFVASIEQKHLPSFIRTARTWPLGRASRITLVSTPLVVSQWAQDNGKVGLVRAASGRDRVVTLVPRYASRRSDGSVFIPNESFLMGGFASAGHDVVQSPLLFQGGNMMAVRDPASGERILLIGEAEVYRNVSLGLSKTQAIESFRVEFGVDRIIVLPAVSFHIDFEVNVRAISGRLVAFVNDSPSAVRIILECGLAALEKNDIVSTEAARTAREHLAAGRTIDFINIVSGVLRAQSVGQGQYPLSLAGVFSTGPPDSGVGNFQRFLLAIDLLAGWSVDEANLPVERHAASYVRSFHRRDADRARLHKTLFDAGFKVVGIPSLSEGEHGINYINGIHSRSRYVMPAFGGLYTTLDHAAERAFHGTLGAAVRVVPVLCAETQQRGGAVHCAVSVYPR